MTIKIYGHRGARGLSPENSLPGYLTALAIGVDVIDMDVGMTKDGVVVVTHDAYLDPRITRDAKGEWIGAKPILVHELTLAELQTFDVGRIHPASDYHKLFPCQFPVDHTRIPTVQEVIRLLKRVTSHPIGLQIEIKTNPKATHTTATPQEFAQAIAKIIKQEAIIERTEVQAFDFRCLQALQQINPLIKTAYLTDHNSMTTMSDSNTILAGLWTGGHLLKNYGYSIPRMIAALGGKIWGPEDTELTAELIHEAHELGLKVVPWSWPEKIQKEIDTSLLEKLISWGVDGIITDRPDILRGLLAARGIKIPLQLQTQITETALALADAN